jgi:hypothetical protein
MRYILIAPAVLIAAAIAMYLYLCHACQYAELFDDEAYGD